MRKTIAILLLSTLLLCYTVTFAEEATASSSSTESSTNSASSEYKDEEGILILTDDNFDKAFNTFNYLFVKFYAPWCGHCKQLAPEFVKAQKTLKGQGSPVVYAQVDATVEKKLAQRFSINGYPKLVFFLNKTQIEFNGGRQESDLVTFSQKKTQDQTEEVTTVIELKQKQKDHKVLIAYFGESIEDKEYQLYRTLAVKYQDLVFVHTFNKEVIEQQLAKPHQVVLYKQFDEKRANFEQMNTTFTDKSFAQFIDKYSFADFMEYDDRAAVRISENKNAAILLFSDKKSEKCKDAEEIFKELSKKMKGRILFAVVDTESKQFENLDNFFGIDKNTLPQVRIIGFQSGQEKYRMEDEVTKKNVEKFVSQFRIRRLKQYKKSQKPIDNAGHAVKQFVTTDFDQNVIQSSQDVLVKFYAPWCGHCKQLAPKYEEAAKKLAGNSNIILAEVDFTANEIDGVKVEGYPTLYFYPANKKKSPVKCEARDEEGVIKFLKEHTTYPWVEPAAPTPKVEETTAPKAEETPKPEETPATEEKKSDL